MEGTDSTDAAPAAPGACSQAASDAYATCFGADPPTRGAVQTVALPAVTGVDNEAAASVP